MGLIVGEAAWINTTSEEELKVQAAAASLFNQDI